MESGVQPTRPPKVVVVEDERIIALDLKQALTALEYEVVGLAASGRLAIQIAHETSPDIVLMDVHLEGEVDGIQAAQAIYTRLRIPVVFLTAFAEGETLKRAQASLPFGYLVKPFEARQLHATVQMALSRQAAVAAVERSEERLRLAMDAAQLGVWEWDSASGRVTAVGHTEAIFGEVPKGIGHGDETLLARVHPEDRARLASALGDTLASDQPAAFVFRYLRPGDTPGWIEAYARAYRAAPHAPARVVGVVKDITERRLIEERLRQAGVVLETTGEAIFIMDAARRIISANPAFTEFTGYGSEEAIGADPDVLLHARPHSDQFYLGLPSIPGGRWQGETNCRRKRGEAFPAWESVSVVRSAAGEVTHYVVAFSDISALRRAEAQLNHLAHYDPLTGLPNRLLLNDRMDHALERARRENRGCALLFLDLDGFKVINDTLGHVNGDLLLQTITARLNGIVRRSDTAARLGGDEFVVLLEPIAHPGDAARVAHKMLKTLTAPVDLAGHRIMVSASVGISVYPSDGVDRHALLRAADTAMYTAKAQGRGRYCFHTQEMAVRAAERLDIEQGLRRALSDGELLLHYQPLVSLRGGAVMGVEALVRWRRPGEGIVPPGRFIAIAEDSGIIEQIGRWVLFAACQETAEWCRAAGWPLRLAVNVSARQLSGDKFGDTVRAVLDKTGFPSSQLELEITESTLQVIDQSRHLLDSVKALGVTIAVDDFGTGYSSLSILKHLPIDRLKIDRSFVRDIPSDPNDVAIVEAISALSRTLRLQTTAEGVETAAQLEILGGMECNEAQGYFFCRPQPLAEVQGLVAEGKLAWRDDG